MATEKNEITEQISELHPKDNKNVVVYPKTKSECIIDKIDDIPGEGEQRVVTGNAVDKTAQAIYDDITAVDDKLSKKVDAVTESVTALDTKTENMNKVIATDIAYKDGFTLMHDGEEITGQTEKVKFGTNLICENNEVSVNVNDEKRKLPFCGVIGQFNFLTNYLHSIEGSNYSVNYISPTLGKSEKSRVSNYILQYVFTDIESSSSIFTIDAEVKVRSNVDYDCISAFNVVSLVKNSTYSWFTFKCVNETMTLFYQRVDKSNGYELIFPQKNDTLACLSDIPSVWSQFRHTIDITGTSSDDNRYISLRFTTLSSKNTPVDSFQDLFTLFASTKLQASGSMNNNDTDAILAIIKGINVGTAVTDTTIEFTDKTTETISSYATDLTITDDVTQD